MKQRGQRLSDGGHQNTHDTEGAATGRWRPSEHTLHRGQRLGGGGHQNIHDTEGAVTRVVEAIRTHIAQRVQGLGGGGHQNTHDTEGAVTRWWRPSEHT
jgi:hypothetical protein